MDTGVIFPRFWHIISPLTLRGAATIAVINALRYVRILSPQPGPRQGVAASVIDLFCGAGGLTHGFVLEGFPVIAGIDLDDACRFPYETNNPSAFVRVDIQQLSAADLAPLYPKGDVRILAGCAPCQPFSTYTQGRDTHKSRQWGLLGEFARIAVDLLPEVVTMENVPRLERQPVFQEFVEVLQQAGYNVAHQQVYCPDYGVPQMRRRLVVLASRLGDIHLLPKTRTPESYETVRSTIAHLEPIAAGGQSTSDPLHCSAGLSSLNLQRIRASEAGGTWRQWDQRLRAACHQRLSGKTYPSVYGRMEWDRPSPTVTTQFHGFGNGRFGHPEQDRAISLREGALLQTFPGYYTFHESYAPTNITVLGRLIGNAVPVRLARVIAASIRLHLEVNLDKCQRTHGSTRQSLQDAPESQCSEPPRSQPV